MVPITRWHEDHAGGDQPARRCYKSQGRELINSIEKYITLAIIDNEWKEHLREMDELRRNVQNASIEQKDPLLIYKLESFNLFKAMIERINGEVVGFLAKAGLPSAQTHRTTGAGTAKAPQQRLADQPHGSSAVRWCTHARSSARLPHNKAAHPMPPQGTSTPCDNRCGWRRRWDATTPAPAVAERSTSSATARRPDNRSK